jgi:hypothetical protein
MLLAIALRVQQKNSAEQRFAVGNAFIETLYIQSRSLWKARINNQPSLADFSFAKHWPRSCSEPVANQTFFAKSEIQTMSGSAR